MGRDDLPTPAGIAGRAFGSGGLSIGSERVRASANRGDGPNGLRFDSSPDDFDPGTVVRTSRRHDAVRPGCYATYAAEAFGRSLSRHETATVFESAINAISCQQVSLSLGIHLLNRLIAAYGAATGEAGETVHAFSQPADLATLVPDDLRQLGFSRQKGRAIIEIVRSIVEGRLDFECFSRSPMTKPHPLSATFVESNDGARSTFSSEAWGGRVFFRAMMLEPSRIFSVG